MLKYKNYIGYVVVYYLIFLGSLMANENFDGKPFIIFLNGSCSAGKSSIASQLQRMVHPSLHVGMDHYIKMMDRDYFDKGPFASQGFYFEKDPENPSIITHIKLGPVGEQFTYAMRRSIKALIDNQFNLIIEELLFDDKAFKDYLELFRDYKVYFIAIKPPLQIAEQREKERGNRIIGLAKAQYDHVYKNKIFDLEIDSSLCSPRECADKIMEFIQNQPNPRAFQSNERTFPR